ncbi:MAG: hypothetical protein RIT24_2282 [Planctomycetota bacterium]
MSQTRPQHLETLRVPVRCLCTGAFSFCRPHALRAISRIRITASKGAARGGDCQQAQRRPPLCPRSNRCCELSADRLHEAWEGLPWPQIRRGTHDGNANAEFGAGRAGINVVGIGRAVFARRGNDRSETRAKELGEAARPPSMAEPSRARNRSRRRNFGRHATGGWEAAHGTRASRWESGIDPSGYLSSRSGFVSAPRTHRGRSLHVQLSPRFRLCSSLPWRHRCGRGCPRGVCAAPSRSKS